MTKAQRDDTAAGAPPLTITVLVPTYRRPEDLKRCLAALAAQQRPPDAILLVVRDTDAETREMLETAAVPRIFTIVTVHEPGQVAALNAGLSSVDTDIVAITDDDAAPWPEWTARIVAAFAADASVAGVGGRDHMYVGGELQDGRASPVGIVRRLGKHVGNHHLGFGAPRRVDVLKGANMSYRMSAVGKRRFDTRLRGAGAQVHNDMAFSLALRKAGYTLVYDPAIAVDHFPAQRFDEDQRFAFNALATTNGVYNETLIRLEFAAPWERPLYFAWAVLIGTRDGFGLVQWLRFLPAGPRRATARLRAALKGRFEALRHVGRPRPGSSTG